jgi:hypothetical protein
MEFSSDGHYVWFQSGLALPFEPLQLLLRLEQAGIQVTRVGADLRVSPSSTVTAEDVVQLRRWKRHLLAFLDHITPGAAPRPTTDTLPSGELSVAAACRSRQRMRHGRSSSVTPVPVTPPLLSLLLEGNEEIAVVEHDASGHR